MPGWGASAGIRYATYDLLILVGCYMALLGRPRRAGKRGGGMAPRLSSSGLYSSGRFACRSPSASKRSGGRTILASEPVADRRLHREHQRDSEGVVNSAFIPGFPSDISYVRQMAQVARTHHLSLFATDLGARYAKEQLPVRFLPVTRVVGLQNGARLKGISGWTRSLRYLRHDHQSRVPPHRRSSEVLADRNASVPLTDGRICGIRRRSPTAPTRCKARRSRSPALPGTARALRSRSTTSAVPTPHVDGQLPGSRGPSRWKTEKNVSLESGLEPYAARRKISLAVGS